jgi:FAD/FMN-containing dehydrogenases
MQAARRTIPQILIEAIKGILGAKGWIADPEQMAPLLADQRGLYRGKSPLVVRPASTAEVAAVVRLCAHYHVPIVPQGGNTSLVGGSVPHEAGGEILLSLSRMNHILAVDPIDYTMTVQAGCVLADIQQAAQVVDRLFPLSLGAEGSCEIGGNLSTNAGGVNVIRYGCARDLVLGLEVVLSDGRIWHGLKALRKDNTGYDLKQLFLGAEGTLGIITAAVLKLFPKPREIQTAFCAVTSLEAALTLLAKTRAATGDALTAFELMPRVGFEFVLKHIPGTSDPFAQSAEWYVLMELCSARSDAGLRQTLEHNLAEALEEALVSNAVLAESVAQARALWRLRESLPEAEKQEGGSIKHDVSVPVSSVPEFIHTATARVKKAMPNIRVVAFGHVGDGNIHFNLSQPEGADKSAFLAEWGRFNRIVHDLVHELNGSISAEHGIGRLKCNELKRYKNPVELELMRRIKKTLDPDNLFNPGKLIADPEKP